MQSYYFFVRYTGRISLLIFIMAIGTGLSQSVLASDIEGSAGTELQISGDIECVDVIPHDTDERITEWNEPHYVCIPDDTRASHAEVVVFLPGTGGKPSDYTLFIEEAAQAGFYAIGLRYPNDQSVNLQICPRDPDMNCHELVRDEILNGADTSPSIAIDEANAIDNRLHKLLAYLAEIYPDQHWNQYLTGDEITWSNVIIAGHSQGGGHAAFIAFEHPVARAILFAAADVRRGELAPWLTENTSATPFANYYLFWHVGDERVATYQPALIDLFGLAQFGDVLSVEINDFPYDNTHMLVAEATPPDNQRAHNAHIVDWAVVRDATGNPLYRDAWRYLIGGQPVSDQAVNAGVSIRLGDSYSSYIDPEFLTGAYKVAFADQQRTIWLGDIDPRDGTFVNQSGKDLAIQTTVTPLRTSFNGPEFGIDENGWALFYTKDVDGIPQAWRADIDGTQVTNIALSEGERERSSILASKNQTASSVQLAYVLDARVEGDLGNMGWFDEDLGLASEQEFGFLDTGLRWIDDAGMFVYVQKTGNMTGQIMLYDTTTQLSTPISNDAGVKTYAYGWFAPEYDGELLILAVVDDAALAIYRDNGGDYWERIATVEIPTASKYHIIGSPETFTTATHSYVTLVTKARAGYAPAEVWVLGIEDDPTQNFALQCQDDLGDVIRSDPESMAGEQEVFVYYNAINATSLLTDAPFQIYRCATGLAVAG